MSELENFLRGVAQSHERRARGAPAADSAESSGEPPSANILAGLGPVAEESRGADSVFDALDAAAEAANVHSETRSRESASAPTVDADADGTSDRRVISARRLAKRLKRKASLREALLLSEILRRPTERWDDI